MLASEIFRLLFGFVAVLGMIGLCALAAKKAGLASMAAGGGRKRRLSLREALPLDARRRLAIVKCDDTEYLIVLGPTGETVIDKGLKGGGIVEGDDADQEMTPALENPFARQLGSFAVKLRSIHKDAA